MDILLQKDEQFLQQAAFLIKFYYTAKKAWSLTMPLDILPQIPSHT